MKGSLLSTAPAATAAQLTLRRATRSAICEVHEGGYEGGAPPIQTAMHRPGHRSVRALAAYKPQASSRLGTGSMVFPYCNFVATCGIKCRLRRSAFVRDAA